MSKIVRLQNYFKRWYKLIDMYYGRVIAILTASDCIVCEYLYVCSLSARV